MTHSFSVGGMTCGHCDRAVRAAIENLDVQASVHIERCEAAPTQVRVDSERLTREQIAAAITQEGYSVQ